MTQYLAKSLEGDSRQHTLVLHSGQSPADALASVEPDAELMKQAAKKGAVWVKRLKPNGQMTKLTRLRDLHDDVLDGSELIANINPKVLAISVDKPVLLEQHKNFSFWYKPRGVLSQGSKWGDHTSIVELVADELERTTHLVHRLDRYACGLMVLAHTRPAVKELTALFAKRVVIKRYRTVVTGKWIEPLPHRCDVSIDERTAITDIESANYTSSSDQTELLIRLHTGRKHQIRRHLSAMNFPIVGDKRYGNVESALSLALMSIELGFDCPFSKQFIRCVVPEKLQNTLLSSSKEVG